MKQSSVVSPGRTSTSGPHPLHGSRWIYAERIESVLGGSVSREVGDEVRHTACYISITHGKDVVALQMGEDLCLVPGRGPWDRLEQLQGVNAPLVPVKYFVDFAEAAGSQERSNEV